MILKSASFQGKRVLILAPLVTLSNWANEFRKWHVEGFTTVLGQVFNFGGRLVKAQANSILN